MAKSILFSSVTLFFIIPFAGAIGPTYWTYMPNASAIYPTDADIIASICKVYIIHSM